MTKSALSFKLLPIMAATLALIGCTPAVVKQSAPQISRTIGKLDQPAEDVLPIIRSEPVAHDPQRAVDNYRKLLELAPDVDTRNEAQRRLADLQVQIADSQGTTDESEKQLQESVSLYNKLLYADPTSADNDRIFYQLARAQQNLGETDASIDTLKRLTDRHPDSRLIGDARFRRAELLFNRLRYSEAEAEYKTVMALGDATPFFASAQYKYGWSQYKQSKYTDAITTFFAALDRELPEGDLFEPEPALARVEAASNDMIRDSLRVITLSLAALGGGPALSEYLTTHGDPRFYPLVYVALGQAMHEKERYTDAAGAYAAFIERYPSSPLAPSFQSRTIGAYIDGGFSDLVIREKQRYAVTYDPDAPYWAGRTATAEVLTELRAHLGDLARFHHAQAQQNTFADAQAKQAEFLVAARWYRRIIELYPQDPQLAEVNFLLGDSLLDGGQTLAAAQEYDRTAYGYPSHARAAEAAYASVLAYEKHAAEIAAEARPEALRLAIDAGIKLADQFPEHPTKLPVLLQVAKNLFELKSYDEAIDIAARVLQAQPPAAVTLRRNAWSVTGDSHFAQNRYADAETAFSEELRLTPQDATERGTVIEQLAASIYKQGEVARDAEDLKTAAHHFLRVGQVTPQSSIHATAEYDGASALFDLQEWSEAARVLEGFRQRFAGHRLEADVDKKLAVAYQRDGKALPAARTYARIARRDSEALAVRSEAAWLSASLFDQGQSNVEAASAYEYYVTTFPRPLDRALDARSRLVDYARSSGNTAALSRWLQDLVNADQTAGQERSTQSQLLAAQASLDLGRMAANQANGIALTLPIQSSLPARNQAMQNAIGWLNKTASYGFAETTTAATYELGQLYSALANALVKSERPRGLSELELEQYELLLEEQADPFIDQAIGAHEANLQRLKTGLYDNWIARSAAALAHLSPARYGKLEQGDNRYDHLD